MKKKFIIAISVFIILVMAIASISAVAASRAQEPDAANNESDAAKYAALPDPLPDHLAWNPDLGEYYNAEDFIWNSERQRYEPRTDNKTVRPLGEVTTYQEWKAANENSDNYVIKAFLAYREKSDALFAQDPTLKFSSAVNYPEEAIAILTDLGYSAMADMYEFILEDEYMREALIVALEKMTGVQTDVIPWASDTGDEKWMNAFEAMVIEAAEATITSTADVEKYGVFSLLHAEEMTTGSLSSSSLDSASSAAITQSLDTIRQEKSISDADIKALAEFVQYIKSVNTVE